VPEGQPKLFQVATTARQPVKHIRGEATKAGGGAYAPQMKESVRQSKVGAGPTTEHLFDINGAGEVRKDSLVPPAPTSSFGPLAGEAASVSPRPIRMTAGRDRHSMNSNGARADNGSRWTSIWDENLKRPLNAGTERVKVAPHPFFLARTATAGAAGPGGLPRGSRACQSSPRSGLFVVTSYCDHGTTASGRQAGPGQCAGPRWVPLGTVVWIEGYGRAVVTDRTALRFNGRWDVWLPTRAAAMAWGKRTVRVEVVSTPQKSDSR